MVGIFYLVMTTAVISQGWSFANYCAGGKINWQNLTYVNFCRIT